MAYIFDGLSSGVTVRSKVTALDALKQVATQVAVDMKRVEQFGATLVGSSPRLEGSLHRDSRRFGQPCQSFWVDAAEVCTCILAVILPVRLLPRQESRGAFSQLIDDVRGDAERAIARVEADIKLFADCSIRDAPWANASIRIVGPRDRSRVLEATHALAGDARNGARTD